MSSRRASFSSAKTASHHHEDDSITHRPYYYSPNVPLSQANADRKINADNNNNNTNSINEYSFFDEAILYVRAGSGGQGSNSYKKLSNNNHQRGPPDGGNGGKGGNVRLLVDPSLNTLAGLTQAWRPNSFGGSGASATVQTRPKSFRAENGSDGGSFFKSGASGKDVTIRVPPGTVVEECVGEEEDIWKEIGSMQKSSDPLVVAHGGQGGEGTAVQGKNRGVKRPRISPTGGERKQIKLTLKIVADVALVGVPNAGKSTFLAAVTRAKPKIANYPFTTVIPNLGVWIPTSDTKEHEIASLERGAGSEGLVICDVPGLIAGAAKGVGLGHAFLRHVERCHVILHLVDATSDNPVEDFLMLNREIVEYGSGQLAQKPQVVVINKMDSFDRAAEDWEEGLQVKWTKQELADKITTVMPHSRLMWMSAKERDGVDELMMRLASFVKKVKEAETK